MPLNASKKILSTRLAILFSTLFGLVLFFISKDFGMFWDNVLFASKMGNYLYENGILNWNIPESFDPGHPPFLGFLLAITWKLFGKSLWVSHLLMLPFVIGTFVQLLKFISFYIHDKKLIVLGLVLLVADPSLLSTLMLVSPEILILFFFFLTLNGILYNQKKWKFIGLIFLSIISFRSMMLFGGLFVFDAFNRVWLSKRAKPSILFIKEFFIYLIASIPGAIFVGWRLLTTGWLQTHSNSPWKSLWNWPSLEQFISNLGILLWRYLDFGRVFIFVFLIIAVIHHIRKKHSIQAIAKLIVLALSSVSFIILASIFSTNAFGHRYFLVSYSCLILASYLLLLNLKHKRFIYLALLLGLSTGNLWVYPKKISQGWDSTLAHTPYHSLRIQAIQYLDSNQIELNKVGSFFPNYNSLDEIDLNKDSRRMAHFDSKNEYVFYSNVFNLSDTDLESLQANYQEIQVFGTYPVQVIILKRKPNFSCYSLSQNLKK